jgi:TRAP-type uncharacterized transport system substrate-binding protein
MFLRGVDDEMSPEKVYQITKALTDDEDLAQKKKAWQTLNNTR